MQTSKRRKVAASNALIQGNISSYARTSKAITPSKFLLDKSDIVASKLAKEVERNEDRKRKAELIEEEDAEADDEADNSPSTLTYTVVNQRTIRPLPHRSTTCSSQLSYQTPSRPITSNSSPTRTQVKESPTKGANSLFAGLGLESPVSSPVYSSQQTSSVDYFSTQSPADNPQLPLEFQELVNLHSAFLTALSLHYAHNGTHTPADLRSLCPDVARAWGKRKVLLQDIRRLLAILNHVSAKSSCTLSSTSVQLSLSDYGMGKICIEIKTSLKRVGRIARPLDEDHMNDVFVRNLREIFDVQPDHIETFTERLGHLPLEPIATCSSLSKMSPLLAKGQRRLSDMRAGTLAKQEAASAKAHPLQEATSSSQLARKPSLLERLRAKSEAQAKLPPPPSQRALSREAGLHRLHEVIAVLTQLSTSSSIGQSRISFTLPTVVGRLQDSFKTPMSKEEAKACVVLLASEITPEWLGIVRMGKTEAVVVSRDSRPLDDEISRRVANALAT